MPLRRLSLLLAVLVAAVCGGAGPATAAETVIGVLAYRGGEAALRTWAPTVAYLRDNLPGQGFRVEALALDDLDKAAAAGRLDFVITNPGHSYQLVRRTGASRVASARSLVAKDQTRALGSVIVVRADSPMTTLADLRDHRLGIVAPTAFGGHLLARHAIRTAIGKAESSVGTEVIGFPHQAVLDAVLAGTVEAGVLRACLIESLTAQGRLDRARIRVLGPRDEPRFACATSTGLYPGWAFLKMPHVPPERATEVTRALLAMPRPRDSDPWLGHDGWIAPVSYQAVEAVYRDLSLYPFSDTAGAVLRRWVLDNLVWVAVGVILLGAFLLHVGHVEYLVRRRTRQWEAAAQRNRTLEGELAHVDRVMSMNILAGSLAHDLNQPLAAISAFARGLLLRQERGTADAEAITATLTRISEQANRASEFIRSMRAFLTKRPDRAEALDLRDLVDEVVMLMATHARHASIALAWQRPAAAVPVQGDGVQLRQVIVALVQNAIDAMAEGGTIVIALAGQDATATLTVTDQGGGLTAEARDQAFEPFFSTKGGLGLGLATASGIVDHHDGHLTLDPCPDGGTVARLVLPLWRPETGEAP